MPLDTSGRRDVGTTLYAVFVGVLITGVLGIATTATFPIPDPYSTDRAQVIGLHRMLMSLATSLVVMAAGLFLPARIEFLRLGLMLAGVANLVLGNFWGWNYDSDWIRLLAALASLVIAVAAGIVRINRRTGVASAPGDATPNGDDPVAPASFEARLRAVEQRLDAARAALTPPSPDSVNPTTAAPGVIGPRPSP